VVTGEGGTAELPPIRPGKLTLAARAERYHASEPREWSVLAEDEAEEYILALEPVGDTVEVRVSGPLGAPAQSEVLVASPPQHPQTPNWRGASDAAGRIAVPRDLPPSVLVVRSPGAGFHVAPWPPSQDVASIAVVLPAAAPPLTIATVDGRDEPVPFARVALWVAGYKLSDGVLAWATGSRGAGSRANGRCSLANLPVGPLEGLAWTGNRDAEAFSGGLDGLRTRVAYPWPEPWVLEVIR
jgi:hypothetical protein